MFSAADHKYMAQALRLAERGLYTTTPNPRVGCVIVRDGVVVGEGWHERAGKPHAEVHALRRAGTSALYATAYVTLEPCSHHGRTPPCAEALIAAGVTRVVAAMRDPNPLVGGNGLTMLQAHGIQAECGLLETQARELNPGFISRMERGQPWVKLKIAASLDGATALENGISQWITGNAARLDVQHWRARSCAILTGIGTVLADDPQLNVRDHAINRQPLKVVVDSHLRLPSAAKVLHDGNLLIACLDDNTPHGARLCDAGAELLTLPGTGGKVNLAALLAELAHRQINEVLVEAGAVLNGALLHAGLANELLIYYAPLLMGSNARGMFNFPALTAMNQRIDLEVLSLDHVGQDLRLRARVK